MEILTRLSDIITIPAIYRHYWNKYTDKISAETAMREFINIFEELKESNSYFILLTQLLGVFL